MKKIGLVIILIVAFLGGLFGYKHFSQQHNYNRVITQAHDALNEQNWTDAQYYYEAAQKDHKTVEARTALQQLRYAVRADKSAQQEKWHMAADLYHTALGVDGAIPAVNKNIKIAAAKVQVKLRAAQAAKESSKRAASESSRAASASSNAAASSRAESLSSSIAASSSRASSLRASSESRASSLAASESKASRANEESSKNEESASSEASSSDSQPSDTAPSASSDARNFDSADVATARQQLIDQGFNVADLPTEEIQAAMNEVINSHGGLTLADVAQQHKW